MDEDKKRVSEFLAKMDLSSEPFEKKEMRKSKTPDLRVFSAADLVFYCEVKTIAKDLWLRREFEKNPASPFGGGLRKDPVDNRLSNKIHEAVAQFDAVNPELRMPNVLAFVNHDRMCGYHDLVNVITGCFFAEDGRSFAIFKNISEGRIKEEKVRIHLFIWMDENGKVRFLFNQLDARHLLRLCSYFGVDSDSIATLSA